MATKKLPENIKFKDEDSGNVFINNTSTTIDAIVKQFKVGDFTDAESGAVKKAKDIVRDFFMMVFNATDEAPAELPDGFEEYSEAFEKVKEYVEGHLAVEAGEKKAKEAEKNAKAEQKEAAKQEKLAEDKKYLENQGAFEASLIKKNQSAGQLGEKLISAVTKSIKLPSNITISDAGTGILFGDNVSVAQIGEAAGSILAALEGNNQLEGALQFMIGDLVNKAVNAGVFRTKNEAQQAIAFALNDSKKLGKSYNPGSLNYYANMAARIPLASRKAGIAPSLYLAASKIAPPKLKAASEEDQKKIDVAYEELRNETVEAINSGDIKQMKDVEAKVKAFNEERGIVKTSPGDFKKNLDKWLKQFYYAHFAKDNLIGVHKEGVVVFEKEPGAFVELDSGGLTNLIE